MASTRPPRSLASGVAVGAAWLTAGRLLVRGIGLISTIVLARLLLPEDFGLVALATALLFVLETLSDLRFEQAIIAQRDTAAADLNTAWTLNLLRGAAIGLVIAAAAYPYALLMADTRLTPLLLVLAVVPLIDGLKNPAFVTFEKSMVFHKEFRLQLAHRLSTFVVTLSAAWLLRSYWALVAGMLTGSAVRVSASYLMHPFRPRPELTGWRRLAAFSGWLMGANLTSALTQKLEFFLLGAFLPVKATGIYHVGSEISGMATREVVLPVKRALFPALSSLAAEPAEQYRRFRQSVEFITALTLPIGVGLALLAEPAVRVVLGERWLDAAGVIAYLAPLGAAWAVSGLCDALVISSGRTRLVFVRELVRASYVVPLYVAGVWLGGLHGILIAAVCIAIATLFVSLDMVRRHSAMPLLRPLLGTWRSVAACLLMALVVASVRPQPSASADVGTLLLELALSIAVGAASYLACHLLLWLAARRPAGIESFVLAGISPRAAPASRKRS